jgi:ribonuclease HII
MLQIQYAQNIAGTDEAGRGCLAGPVTAAAVIFPKDLSLPLINDSKKLTEKQRYYLRPKIEKLAIAFGVAHVFQEEIDEINILNASIKAMQLALRKLSTQPSFILIDGNHFKPYNNVPFKCIIKGDEKYQNIAAASILAKTYRDDLMINLDKGFPQYSWKKNKGYPTKEHREAIKKHGITDLHRKSFKLLLS